MGAVPPKILIVDDEPQIPSAISLRLRSCGFDCEVSSDPREAQRLLSSGQPDILIVDVAMPEVSGLDLLLHAKQHAPGCKVILYTGLSNRERLAQALILGAYDYLEKPLRADELVKVVTEAVGQQSGIPPLPLKAADAMELTSRTRRASLDSVQALIRAIEAKDPFTRRHSEHVTHYALGIAEHLEMPLGDLESLCVAALLHDVGKIGVPDRILTKPGALTDREWEHIRRHPVLGADILAKITIFGQEAHVVRHHHERWDGKGYPDGLTGEESPLASRIIMVADSVDAMLMARSYKASYPIEKMLDELRRCAGTQFDPQIAKVALEWCETHPEELILPGTSRDMETAGWAVMQGIT